MAGGYFGERNRRLLRGNLTPERQRQVGVRALWDDLLKDFPENISAWGTAEFKRKTALDYKVTVLTRPLQPGIRVTIYGDEIPDGITLEEHRALAQIYGLNGRMPVETVDQEREALKNSALEKLLGKKVLQKAA